MFERLFDNIGGKIKVLAKVVFILEAIAAVIAGIAILVIDDGEGPLMPLGFITMIGGPVIAWISSLLLYGFGELIDKAGEIARNTSGGPRKSEAQSKVDDERISKIERLRSQGLISEEEYQQAISKKR